MRQWWLQCRQVLFLPPFLLHIVCQRNLWDTLSMIISFLVLWSICLSSSLVHFKNGPEYLTRGTTQVFIPLIRCRPHSFVSRSFMVLLGYYFIFIFFFHLLLFDGVSFQDTKCLYVSFSPSVLILSIRCRLPLFITSMSHFSTPNSIPMSWLYILTACIRVSRSFSFFANSLMLSMHIRWLIFFCDLLSLYPAFSECG